MLSEKQKELVEEINGINKTQRGNKVVPNFSQATYKKYDPWKTIYTSAVELTKNLSTPDLIELFENESPTIQFFAIYRLAQNSESEVVLSLLDQILSSTEMVDFQSMGKSITIGDACLMMLTSSEWHNDCPKLTNDQILSYISKLSTNRPSSYFITETMDKMEVSDSKRSLLLQLISLGNTSVLKNLGIFQNTEDIDLIKKYLESEDDRIQWYAIQSVVDFPHEAFKPFLDKNVEYTYNPSFETDFFPLKIDHLLTAISNYEISYIEKKIFTILNYLRLELGKDYFHHDLISYLDGLIDGFEETDINEDLMELIIYIAEVEPEDLPVRFFSKEIRDDDILFRAQLLDIKLKEDFPNQVIKNL